MPEMAAGHSIPPQTVTAEEFRDTIGRFASGVTVITARADGELRGATASAVTSLSLEPPMLLVCLNATSATGRAIASSGRFAVNVLDEGHADLALRFAGGKGDRFAGLDLADDEDADGPPLLSDALATFDCHVAEEISAATHRVFLAHVRRASARNGTPLAYFRGQFGRLELQHDQAALEALRGQILARAIAPGDAIDLTTLAADLDTPRASVYHALVKLAAGGLVDRGADGSFTVRPVTLAAIMASVRTRYAMLAGSALLSLGAADPRDAARLRALARSVTLPHAPQDARGWVDARAAFGEAFLEATGGGDGLDAFRRADVPALILSLWSRAGLVAVEERQSLADGFVTLVDAYANGDAARLVAVAQTLVARYEQIYTRSFADQSEI